MNTKYIFTWSLALLIGISSFAQIPTQGLIAHYPFDGNAIDLTNNQNHGIIDGPVVVKDRFGVDSSAYRFDGVNDFIYFGSPATLMPSSITINFWVKLDDPNRIMFFMSNALPGPGTWGASAFYANDGTGWRTTVGGGINNRVLAIKSNINADSSKWQMYTMTYGTDSNTLNLFIDGKFITKQNFFGTVGGFTSSDSLQHDSNTSWYFGMNNERRKQALDPYYFKGLLDDMRIYNRALTHQEVMDLFSNSRSTDIIPLSKKVPVIIYPNPTSGNLRIAGMKSGKVEIYDMAGKWLRSYPFIENSPLKIDLQSGHYLVILNNGNGRNEIKQLFIK